MQKLVRDRIPEIMAHAGTSPDITVLEASERLHWLSLKLTEEVAELTIAPNLEECADVYEVLVTLAAELGHSYEDLVEAAKDKRSEKGGFSKGFILSIPQ